MNIKFWANTNNSMATNIKTMILKLLTCYNFLLLNEHS